MVLSFELQESGDTEEAIAKSAPPAADKCHEV
jgi:hypothetical protein